MNAISIVVKFCLVTVNVSVATKFKIRNIALRLKGQLTQDKGKR